MLLRSQMSYWMDKGVLSMQGLIGCFAMTELRGVRHADSCLLRAPAPSTDTPILHAQGSNVAGLETTATFDEKSDEFIIHTPRIEATKWWIGGEYFPAPFPARRTWPSNR